MDKILLSDIVDAMEGQMDGISAFLNTKTGETEFLYSEFTSDLLDEESSEENRQLEEAISDSDDYIQIPDKFDINEYRMMVNFSLSIPGEIGEMLYKNLSGSGAFRRFKNNINRFGIEDDWYKFRNNSYFNCAKDWCEFHELPFIDNRIKE